MPKELDYMTFGRDDIDGVYSVYPRGHEKYPEGRSVTKRETINESIAERDSWFGRRDIAMLNISENYADDGFMQLVVEPTRSGIPDIPPLMQSLLTRDELAALTAMNKRLIEVEREAGWPIGTLSGY